MSVSRNYYLRRAYELEAKAAQSPTPGIQSRLRQAAKAFRDLAYDELTHRVSPLRIAEVETLASTIVESLSLPEKETEKT